MFEFEIDISEKSYSIDNLSTVLSYQIPLFVHAFGYYEAGPRHFVRSDRMQYAQLIYTISGEGILINETIGHSCALVPGTATLTFGTMDKYYYHTVSKEPWVMKWLRLEGTGIPGYMAMFGREPKAPALADPAAFEAKIDAAKKTINIDSPAYRARESAYVASMLSDIADGIFEEVPPRPIPPDNALGQIVWSIQLKPEADYSIRELADQAGMSQYRFIRYFKEKVGYTPYQFILRNRIKKAIMLLSSSNSTIEAIAEECGFYDSSSFIRCFEKMTSITPTDYRRLGGTFFALSYNGNQLPFL